MSLIGSDLWGAVAANLGGVYLEGAVGSGTTTTIVDDMLLRGQYSDDYLNHCWCSITVDAGGAHASPEGQSRLISDFASSTGTITVATAFTVAPASGDTYRVWSVAPKVECLAGVSEALHLSWPSFYQRTVDETVAIAEDTYEYTLPTAIEHLEEVLQQADAGATHYVPIANWRVLRELDGTRTLILDHTQSYRTGYQLRLVGIGPLSYPLHDYDPVEIQGEYEGALLEFVGAYGAAVVLDRLMLRDSKNDRLYAHRYETLMARAKQARQRGMSRPDGRVRYVLPEYWS